MGFNISYGFQEKATGTAHAVYLARKYVEEESFVVVYGDNYFESAVPIVQAVDFHVKKKAEATLLLHYLNKPYGSGLVKLDNDGRVLKIVEKPSIRESIMFKIKNKYIAISGLHILEPTVFQFIERTRPGRNGETWLTDSIELMREDGHSVYGILSRVRVWDIGTPEIMRKIQTSIA